MRRMLIAALSVPVLVFVSCGDDDDDAGGGEASTSIAAKASEFKFEPNSWTVPAGQEFSVDFENAGQVEHEWAVVKQGEDIESEEEFTEDKVLFEIEEVPAGESRTEEFTVDEPGTYQVICAVETHFDAGMEGSLTVE